MRRVLTCGAVLGLIAPVPVTPALADPPPLLRPSKDVAIEYRVEAAQGDADPAAHIVTMYFTDQGDKMRFDGAGGHGYMIVDQKAKRTLIVMTAQHMYMEQGIDPSRSPLHAMEDATFTREGTDTVAGVACTVYQVTHNGEKGEACLTDDGLMLRSHSDTGGQSHGMVARKVEYAPQPASLFAPPAGFQKMDMSAMMRGAMPPNGMPGGVQGGTPGPGSQPGRTAPGAGASAPK